MASSVRLTEAQLDSWKAVRERGFAWYIAKTIAISLVVTIVTLALWILLFWYRGANEPMNRELATKFFVFIPFIGAWVGVINWRRMNAQYELQSREPKPNRYMTDEPTPSPE
jgi:uncharacterized membrane protein YidH (DUF202 family)